MPAFRIASHTQPSRRGEELALAHLGLEVNQARDAETQSFHLQLPARSRGAVRRRS